MSFRGVKAVLLACSGIGVLLAATADANAGGFAVREQSAYGQGSSFAGIAAGGALSSMFWNPAIITQFNGKTIEQDATGILPNASHSFTTATDAALGNAGNSGMNALVPSGYSSWQFNEKLWLGMSVNAPFGLAVHFPQAWAGARGASGESANIGTYNFSPTVAYKLTDWISVAVGMQAQYLKASYDFYLGAGPLIGSLNGAGWSYGWTAGVTLTPLPKTQIGIGYRSSLDQKLNGTLAIPAVGCPFSGLCAPSSTPGSVNLVLPLPDVLTVGLRQGIGDRFTLLAGLEWSHWSRIGTPLVYQPNGAQALVGTAGMKFPFQYHDGWFYSLGGEYMINPAWKVRAGIAFEKSPITDDIRTARIPDNDRMWYSVGASYKPASMRGFTFDLGYSFIKVKDTPICMGVASGCPTNPWSGAATYIGSVDSHINIVSIGVRYQWGDAAPAPTSTLYHK
jgi:long-chain fatty acid transport protein